MSSLPKPPRMMLSLPSCGSPARMTSSSPSVPSVVEMSLARAWFRFTTPLSPSTMFRLPRVASIRSEPTPPRMMLVPPWLRISSAAARSGSVSGSSPSGRVSAVGSVVNTLVIIEPVRSTWPLSPSTTAVPPPSVMTSLPKPPRMMLSAGPVTAAPVAVMTSSPPSSRSRISRSNQNAKSK